MKIHQRGEFIGTINFTKFLNFITPVDFRLLSTVCQTFNSILSFVATKYLSGQSLKTLELDFIKKSNDFPKFHTVSEEFLMKRTSLLKLVILIGQFEITQVRLRISTYAFPPTHFHLALNLKRRKVTCYYQRLSVVKIFLDNLRISKMNTTNGYFLLRSVSKLNIALWRHQTHDS